MNILVACVGNIFQGDDAFGCAVAVELSRRSLPGGVRVVDFGIRGVDLTYALLDRPDLTILVDTVARGGPPGTLYTIEPELEDLAPGEERGLNGHSMDPLQVLRTVKSMGGNPTRTLVVGCQPADLGGPDGSMGLTPAVEAAVISAADMVEALIANELEEIQV